MSRDDWLNSTGLLDFAQIYHCQEIVPTPSQPHCGSSALSSGSTQARVRGSGRMRSKLSSADRRRGRSVVTSTRAWTNSLEVLRRPPNCIVCSARSQRRPCVVTRVGPQSGARPHVPSQKSPGSTSVRPGCRRQTKLVPCSRKSGSGTGAPCSVPSAANTWSTRPPRPPSTTTRRTDGPTREDSSARCLAKSVAS